MSHQDLFVQLSENRLQQSLVRINTTDSRALGLLGLIAVLMTGLWAVYLTRHSAVTAHFHVALVLLFIAMIFSGWCLLLTAQFDNPNLAEFYQKYYAASKETYPAYFTAVITAIHLNNAVIRRKTSLLLIATLSLFLSVLVIIL